MGKHKKNKVKKEKTQHVYRTLEERKAEVRKIIEKLEELHLSIDYEPIKQFYDIMFNYIRTIKQDRDKISYFVGFCLSLASARQKPFHLFHPVRSPHIWPSFCFPLSCCFLSAPSE